ncbi:potassium transporter TrkA [Alsobacter soli]|uniref:Potassium transporter TrkA n=1 Tax=Alsobacter soli TaxID=2109933 RepID=A0A2T1HSI1_9HYPH|nr:monovalent cation:proton antiporter-2 (CPA2) family protein [Alsobacter soli]PSC04621.1 potassium transporter TrkA [Alsobacter soli]
MPDHPETTSFLAPILIFCLSAVLAVPLFKRLGLGAVIGYLVAGAAIGPAGLRLFTDANGVRTVAEVGVVMLLFVIGLELKPSKLLAMRRDIFGLGTAQFLATGVVIAGAAMGLGASARGATLLGVALALSATAIALQILDERGTLQTPYGQRTFSVLLFQDMAVVPILALVPLLAPESSAPGGPDLWDGLRSTGVAMASIAAIVVAGLYLLNPLFRVLAWTGAREVMTAAALLVVLGAALLMEHAGMSMALGAFLAGLLLSESNFRHQLEADIEPFRGLLLGLFFMSVGMGMDAKVILAEAVPLLLAAVGVVALKIAVAYGLERWMCSARRDALRSAALLAPAGEFAFVLLPMAGALGILSPQESGLASALAALTMVIGPIVAKLIEVGIARREAAQPEPEFDPASFDGAHGSVLVIGFGRFGQIATQVLLADGVDVTVIDKDVDRIKAAGRFGFKVYYGDGARLDVLRASGAGQARVIAICVDDRQAALAITELVRENFPLAQVHARAYDRIHAIDLIKAGVDYQIRATLSSALEFGRETLVALGSAAERAEEVRLAVRERDEQRLALQQAEGKLRPADYSKVAPRLTPEPLVTPKAKSRALSAETQDVMDAPERAD